MSDLTDDDKAVIHARHFGWEKASPSLLAAVFGVSRQKIVAILREDTPPFLNQSPDEMTDIQSDLVVPRSFHDTPNSTEAQRNHG